MQTKRSYAKITAAETPVWWCCDLRGFRRLGAEVGGIPVYFGCSDAPYRIEHLSSKLIGRIVGVSRSALDAQGAQSESALDRPENNEVTYRNIANDRLLRHCSFLGLYDKPEGGSELSGSKHAKKEAAPEPKPEIVTSGRQSQRRKRDPWRD